MNEIKIHDIKELVEIPDFSLYIYMTLWILGVIVLIAFIFFIYRYFYNKSRCQRREYFKTLKELDLENSKESAYKITKYARLLAHSQREKKLCNELIEELENFKYKKEVEPLNDNVKIIFGRFMDSVDV